MSEEIETAILRALYCGWNAGDQTAVNLNAIRLDKGWDERSFRLTCERLERVGMLDQNYELTASGVVQAEKVGAAPDDLYQQNREARSALLLELQRWAEHPDPLDSVHYKVLATNCGLDETIASNNLPILTDWGYIYWPEYSDAALTDLGRRALEDAKHRYALSAEFEKVSLMEPKARGRAFEDLFAKLVESAGWSVETNAKTSNEEFDVVISREREHYLIECKWQADPLEDGAVSKLFGRLARRQGVSGGLIVSMSGFSKGALAGAVTDSTSKQILFFGRGDVEAILSGKATFDDLLTHKQRELAVRRRIKVD